MADGGGGLFEKLCGRPDFSVASTPPASEPVISISITPCISASISVSKIMSHCIRVSIAPPSELASISISVSKIMSHYMRL